MTAENELLVAANSRLTAENAQLASENVILTAENQRLTLANAELTTENARLTQELADLQANYIDLNNWAIATFDAVHDAQLASDGLTHIGFETASEPRYLLGNVKYMTQSTEADLAMSAFRVFTWQRSGTDNTFTNFSFEDNVNWGNQGSGANIPIADQFLYTLDEPSYYNNLLGTSITGCIGLCGTYGPEGKINDCDYATKQWDLQTLPWLHDGVAQPPWGQYLQYHPLAVLSKYVYQRILTVGNTVNAMRRRITPIGPPPVSSAAATQPLTMCNSHGVPDYDISGNTDVSSSLSSLFLVESAEEATSSLGE